MPRSSNDAAERQFRARLDGATLSGPDALGIISWNEFSENTQIEPSQLYGAQYLEVLADVVGAQFRSEAVVDSSEPAAGDERAATGVGYGAPLLGGIIVFGVLAVLAAGWRRWRTEANDPTSGFAKSAPQSEEPREGANL